MEERRRKGRRREGGMEMGGTGSRQGRGGRGGEGGGGGGGEKGGGRWEVISSDSSKYGFHGYTLVNMEENTLQ